MEILMTILPFVPAVIIAIALLASGYVKAQQIFRRNRANLIYL